MEADAARRLWRILGRDGIVAARMFVEECERHGDQAAARFWTDIAGQLHAMAEGGGASDDDAAAAASSADSKWRLMQRIERYRHRATQAARAAGPEALRTQMVDIATHWLELARETEALAEGVDAGDGDVATGRAPGRA